MGAADTNARITGAASTGAAGVGAALAEPVGKRAAGVSASSVTSLGASSGMRAERWVNVKPGEMREAARLHNRGWYR
jgi:hypothetical protein